MNENEHPVVALTSAVGPEHAPGLAEYVDLPNSTPITFTEDEYSRRLAAVRERMTRQNLTALIVTDPSNLYYLLGYNALSFYTPQMLYVPLEGELYFFARAMDAAGAFRTSWLPQDQTFGYPETFVQRKDTHPFVWVGQKLRELGVVNNFSHGQVGLEMDSYYFSPRAFEVLVKALPEYRFTDSYELVNWVRVVKSPAEIDLMRGAARVCESAMEAAFESVEIGRRQCDAAAAIMSAQVKGTDAFGGDHPAIVPMLPTGAGADTPHLTWSDQAFIAGETTVVELAGVFRRYHVPMARTIVLGTPSTRLDYLAKSTGEALNAVLDAVRPGATTSDLAQTWNIALAEHGLHKPSRIGYSIGIAYAPDWGERTVSIRTDDDTVLAENMTFHIIGGMWMDDYGYEVSEAVRVTDSGVETFTSFPRHLLTKE
ncbi:M24 family metallopeptidase [Rhodococcus sp. BP-252]|nr:M24 family metallopeptidase [Rhodococcus sp. BP-320]MBY6416653.1 M24 family metallopeptidase [Rhodococcus sp. BP-321]MBY6421158.1 M24 family metallopeptidase [Rhodococcus sp. BP-324]MBY6426677.1 M24 family metallopeptidase [Rhodococcus sp. BP-323]MBY6431676.1 M24 family metallopeptidase [Rhodococcus sp. BP-322]MBY6440707.1 M24 family metallopeptidase [Rhodococcus sp. BP-319]MBY6445775.1 M24 family metallopeptidase [Rhodococcus sp. BP-318]MBY6450590.1 M24 family metallopeptidase [Rhodococc